YYDYYTGRWLTHDPAGYVDGLSLYVYCRLNPLNCHDPMGLATCSCPADPGDCPLLVDGPEMEVIERIVLWETRSRGSVWLNIRYGYERIYKWVDYEFFGWQAVGIQFVGPSCATGSMEVGGITVPFRAFEAPTYKRVVEELRGPGGVWNPQNKIYLCRKKFKCKMRCCSGDYSWSIPWEKYYYGYLRMGGTVRGIPYCFIGNPGPKDVCWDYKCKCAPP
ncbi:MAG: RHS repeat domain-containing protein, partial [Planctomycetota bacterium]